MVKKALLPFLILIILGAGITFLSFNSSQNNLPTENEEKIPLKKALPKKDGKKELVINLDKKKLNEDINLANFYYWTKEDPIFTAPYFNHDEFDSSLMDFEKEYKAFKPLLKKEGDLYPLSFLMLISRVSRVNKEFILNPTRQKAEDLITNYKTALEEYNKNLLSLEKVINSMISNITYHSLGSGTNIKIILEDVEKLEENYKKLALEIEKRDACLNYGTGCESPYRKFEEPKLNKSPSPFTKKDLLKLNLLLPNQSINFEYYSGPYSILTPCFQGVYKTPELSYLFYLFEGTENRKYLTSNKKLYAQVPKIATTNFYKKVSQKEKKEKSFYNNLDWEYYMDGHPYNCGDTSFLNNLAAIDNFYLGYKNKRLFRNLPKTDDLEVTKIILGGIEAENNFFDTEFPSDSAGQYLAEYYAYTYRKIQDWNKAGKFKENSFFEKLKSRSDNFLLRYLEFDRKLSGAEKILTTITGINNHVRLAAHLNPKNLSAYYFAFRNMYGFMYFPFSASFYRLPTPLKYIDSEIKSLSSDYITFQEAIKKYSLEEIKKWNYNQNALIEKDYEKLKKKRTL